jgi:hypothetical protein
MDAQTFVASLLALKPSPQELGAAGKPPELVEEYRADFIIPPLGGAWVATGNPVLDILANYDVARHHPSYFYFISPTKKVDHFTMFAGNEDYIGLNDETGQVVRMSYEYVDGDPEDFADFPPSERKGYAEPVAINGDQFLDALLLVFELYRWRFVTSYGALDRPAKDREFARLCTLAAGGDKFKQFWWGFCGAEEDLPPSRKKRPPSSL